MSRLRTLVAAGLIGGALAGLTRPAWAQEGAPLRTMNQERADYRAGDEGQVREVRLALVCYGGSSLAIYIHGNTKEVHRLVQASKALQQDAMANGGTMQRAVAGGARPGAGEVGQKLTGSTRQWYDRLLQLWLDDPQKVRTRVVVDVIAGTSAGGINGVILAKALAHDLPVDGLTELWLNKASLAKLTNYYFGLLRIFVNRPPVDGNALVGWLFDALNGMDRIDHDHFAKGRTPSLLPKGDRLDLFVTATDRFGYPQNLVIGEPASAVEKRYRHVMHFVYSGVNRGCGPEVQRLRGEIDHFCPEWTPSLAFAARTSSSIPGVFPPLNLGDTMKLLERKAAAGPPPAGTVKPTPLEGPKGVVHSFFRNYQLQEPDEKSDYALSTYFVDGGVLDNHPFGPAIEAIVARPQDQEVRRFLVYLQPDPGTPPSETEKVGNPGLLKTVWAGLHGIPSGQPILDNLDEVAARNTELDRIRDIVQAEERAAQIAERSGSAASDCSDLERLPIAQRFGCALGFEPGTLDAAIEAASQSDLRTVRRKLETAADKGFVEQASTEKREAAAATGLSASGRSYVNLRVHSVLAQFVTVIAGSGGCDYPEATAQRALVAKILGGWAVQEKLIGQPENAEEEREQPAAQSRFLEDFDVGYQRRQLRFVVDWINQQYQKQPAAAKREVLDALKSAAADRIENLTDLVRGSSPNLDLQRELAALAPLFCRLHPWPRYGEPAVSLDRQAEAFLAEPQNLEALRSLRQKLGEVMNRLQQEVRDESFRNFKGLAPRLTPEERREILVRYLAFPFWDRQIYPYVAFSRAGELRDVKIFRLSPNDATLLGHRTAKDKLKGAQAAHFGAFFSRRGREEDYLWGRLDAGDRLLAMLGMGPEGAKALFSAIVEEEKAAGLVRPSILAAREAEVGKLP